MDTIQRPVDDLHNLEAILDTTHLLNEIEDLEAFLTMPFSVSLAKTDLGEFESIRFE